MQTGAKLGKTIEEMSNMKLTVAKSSDEQKIVNLLVNLKKG